MNIKIPFSLKEEHDELHRDLSKAIKLSGKTGTAAKKVAELLHAHFIKEEKYAMPPLGLLKPLSEGKFPEKVAIIIEEIEKLKEQLPEMLAEHVEIVKVLKELQLAAKSEGHSDAALFADKLTLHASTEEQVMYPAAVLVGEFLKLTLAGTREKTTVEKNLIA